MIVNSDHIVGHTIIGHGGRNDNVTLVTAVGGVFESHFYIVIAHSSVADTVNHELLCLGFMRKLGPRSRVLVTF